MPDQSFFNLLPHNDSESCCAFPGIAADEDTWCALVDALRNALNTFNESHRDLTFGDVIHAARCLAEELEQEYLEDTADA